MKYKRSTPSRDREMTYPAKMAIKTTKKTAANRAKADSGKDAFLLKVNQSGTQRRYDQHLGVLIFCETDPIELPPIEA